MFDIEMLPAREGDCLWIRYGTRRSFKQLLIDGGRAATAKDIKARFAALSPKERVFELLIISHVDRDHIEGILSLLTDRSVKVTFKDIWFNGYDHLHRASLETFGAVQGEKLSAVLKASGNRWNRAWKQKSVCLSASRLPSKSLSGGLRLTLLSPNPKKLADLIPVWEQECRDAGIVAGAGAQARNTVQEFETLGGIDIEALATEPFTDDPTRANGSSIAVLAEYKGKRALLSADAHTDLLCESIRKLKRASKRLKLDAFKVSHHGSAKNCSQQLLTLIDCQRFLISTNGSYFGHPTPTAMARLIKFSGRGATLYCNYRGKTTQIWDNPTWKSRYQYGMVFPSREQNGTLRVSL